MFSESERKRRLDAAVRLIRDEGLEAIYLIGNGTVGTNAFGCFRYFTDNRVFFYLSSAVITPDGEITGVVNNQMGRLNLIRSSFVREAIINGDQIDGVVDILKAHNITKGKLGVFFEILPSTWMHRLQAAMPGLELVDVSQQVFALRTEKSDEEIEAQRICGKIADAGYKALCEAARAGARENEVIAAADRAMQKLGMEESFMLITSGRFSAEKNELPTLHNTASINRVIETGDSVAMEITPRYNGYWTQIVRTISVGAHNPDLDEFRSVSVGAIGAAKSILKAGVPVGELVKKMREYIEGRGYRLSMPCGHIAAIDLNEERLSEDNTRPLAPGMLVIIHPTILNDKLPSGIFWGESYLVTETGYEAVMESPDDLFVSPA